MSIDSVLATGEGRHRPSYLPFGAAERGLRAFHGCISLMELLMSGLRLRVRTHRVDRRHVELRPCWSSVTTKESKRAALWLAAIRCAELTRRAAEHPVTRSVPNDRRLRCYDMPCAMSARRKTYARVRPVWTSRHREAFCH
jgi:hypothetical protein